MKTSELTRAALNWAVAKCEEANIGDGYYTGIVLRDGDSKYAPSTDWAQGGVIIEREGLTVIYRMVERVALWTAYNDSTDIPCEQGGTTPLIAAMRCYVASKLGDEVEIPEELTEGESK